MSNRSATYITDYANVDSKSNTLRPPCSTAHLSRAAIFVSGLLLVCAGCADGGPNIGGALDGMIKRVIEPKKTAQQHLLLAVSDSDADIRRQSVGEIAKSKESDRDWAIKGYTAIALLEADSQARCVAVRALGQTRDMKAVEVCLTILNHKDHPPAEVRPPDAMCRWDAITVLSDLTADVVPADQKDLARTTLLRHLAQDDDRNVRAAAARALAGYPHDDTLDGLIEGLRDEQFTVANECETALARLTGVSHKCDTAAWRAWREQNAGKPLVASGPLPDGRKPPYDDRWGKAAYDTKQTFQWLFPGRKPQ